MSFTYAQYQEIVQGYLSLAAFDNTPASLTLPQLATYLGEAVAEHSRFRPRLVTDVTLDGDGSTVQFRLDTLTLPFEEGTSAVERVEYPAGNTPPTIVDQRTYRIDRNSSGQPVLWFLSVPAAGTNNIRLEYTVRHTLTAATNSLPDADAYAVCHLAASFGLLALATKAAHAVDATIQTSERGPRTTSDLYRAVAKEHRTRYFDHFGLTEAQAVAAAPGTAVANWDRTLTWGTDRFWHPRRFS